jgi:hypothetical protein
MPERPDAAAPPPDVWDGEIAADLPGSLVLAGVTYLHPDGSLDHQKQIFGYVLEADRQRGIQLRLEGAEAGKVHWLPPDTRPFRRARQGQYRLRSTGEAVNDPDYTCAWTVHAPKQ